MLLLFKPDVLADMAESLKLHDQIKLFEQLGPERTLEVMQQMDKSDLISSCMICLPNAGNTCCRTCISTILPLPLRAELSAGDGWPDHDRPLPHLFWRMRLRRKR